MNVVGTFVAVILGIPAGLYVNSRMEAGQFRRQAAADQDRLRAAANALQSACVYNRDLLNAVSAFAAEKDAFRNPDLKTSTWEAVGPVFAALSPDPALVDHLSHHWVRLQRVEQLNSEVFSRFKGPLSAIPHNDVMLPNLLLELQIVSETLPGQAHYLHEQLAAYSRPPLPAYRETASPIG